MVADGRQIALGVGEESTFGTAVAPTVWFPILNETIDFNPEDIVSQGMRYGSGYFMEAARRVRSHRAASGGFALEVQKTGMALLFEHMLGVETADTPASGDTTWTVGSLLSKSLTVQKRLYDEALTHVNTYTAKGGKITSWELNLERGSIPRVNLGMDFTDLVDDVTGTSPSYSSHALWTPDDTSITVDSTEVAGILSLSLSAGNPREIRRYVSGAASSVETGYRTMTGTLRYDFGGTTFWDLFDADTLSDWALVFSAGGDSLTVTLQDVHVTGEAPKVGGPGPVEQSVSFEVLYDGTNSPVTIVDEPA